MGQVNGWGSRGALLFFPIFAGALYIVLSVIARFTALFNYPVTVTDSNRARLEALTVCLLAWVKAESTLFAGWMELAWVQAIRHPGSVMRPYPAFAFVAALFATIIGFIAAMFRAAKTRQ